MQETAHPDANIIFGAMVDEKLEDEVWVTVVATGYEPRQAAAARPARARRRAARDAHARAATARTARSTDVDVPEFIPKF